MFFVVVLQSSTVLLMFMDFSEIVRTMTSRSDRKGSKPEYKTHRSKHVFQLLYILHGNFHPQQFTLQTKLLD